jgi:hypothetical protein
VYSLGDGTRELLGVDCTDREFRSSRDTSSLVHGEEVLRESSRLDEVLDGGRLARLRNRAEGESEDSSDGVAVEVGRLGGDSTKVLRCVDRESSERNGLRSDRPGDRPAAVLNRKRRSSVLVRGRVGGPEVSS